MSNKLNKLIESLTEKWGKLHPELYTQYINESQVFSKDCFTEKLQLNELEINKPLTKIAHTGGIRSKEVKVKVLEKIANGSYEDSYYFVEYPEGYLDIMSTIDGDNTVNHDNFNIEILEGCLGIENPEEFYKEKAAKYKLKIRESENLDELEINKPNPYSQFLKDFDEASNDNHDIEYAQSEIIDKYKKEFPHLSKKIDKFMNEFDEIYNLDLDESISLDNIKKFAKKGLLTSTILTTLLASPKFSQAEKNELLKLNTNIEVKIDTSKVIDKIIMDEWNLYIDYLDSLGLKGDKRMDNIPFSQNTMNQFKFLYPNFKLDYTYVTSIQNEIKKYRQWAIERIKSGKVKLNGDPGENYDNFMRWVPKTPVDGIVGQYTSNFKFPEKYLLDNGNIERLGYSTINELFSKEWFKEQLEF